MLAERRVGDVGRQLSGRVAEEGVVRGTVPGPHRVELVGTPEIGPGAALRFRDVRAQRPVHGRASEAYERSVVHNCPYRRRRGAVGAPRIVGPPPDPLQLRVALILVLPNLVERIV